MTRRLLHHVLDSGKDSAITTLVNQTELWFGGQPDGYDYVQPDEEIGCGARTLPTTTATGRSAPATGSTQPQLLLQMGLGQRGLLARPFQRDLPGTGTELRTGDQGA